jgi:DNA gyrase inhibitor GyrI
MKMIIEDIPQSKTAYFRNVGEYGEKQNKELMISFKNWAKAEGLFDNSVILGIPQDNPETTLKEKCRYDVCLVVNKDFEVTKPALTGEFSGGKYAVFLLDHTKEAISEFWKNIFSEIAQNKLTLRNQPIVERYTSQMIENHLCEILVPIQ